MSCLTEVSWWSAGGLQERAHPLLDISIIPRSWSQISNKSFDRSNHGKKEIIKKQILNPYQATEVVVPYNSTLSFYYYRSKDDEGTFYTGPGAYYKIFDDSTYDTLIDGEKDGKLMIATTYQLTDDTELYFVYDNIFTWSREGAWKNKEISFWDIRDYELVGIT